MKKINIIIMSFVAVLFGLLQTACTDNPNEWSVDPSVVRQYAPSSLKVEVDSFSLDLNISVGTLKSAATYELQISDSPLLGGGTDDGDGIATYTIGEDGELTIPRVSENFTIKENMKLYFRARAIGKDGSKSKWYTKGMIYNDGIITDELVAEYMKKNSAFSVSAPAGLWATNIEQTSVQLNWYMLPTSSSKLEKCYCGKPAYVINETLKENGAPESRYKQAITDDEALVYNKVWNNLEVGKSYSFTLWDENGEQIGATTAATEFAPNMDLAYMAYIGSDDAQAPYIIKKAGFTAAGVPYTVQAYNTNFSEDPLEITFNNESAGGWTAASKPYYVSSPDNKALSFDIRAQAKKNTSINIKVPSDGRLYIYAYGASENMITQGAGDEKVEQVIKVAASTKQKLPYDDGTTQSAYISYKVRLTKGEAMMKIDATNSMYFFGFCFVPDDPNAKAE